MKENIHEEIGKVGMIVTDYFQDKSLGKNPNKEEYVARASSESEAAEIRSLLNTVDIIAAALEWRQRKRHAGERGESMPDMP